MGLSVNLSTLIDLGALGITGYPFTLCGWFRVPNVNVLLTLMNVSNSVTGSYHRLIYLGQSTKSAGAISMVGSTSTAASTVAMTTSAWQHVAGVFESATSRRIYLNGGNSAVNTTSRTFDGATSYYVGSFGTDVVDIAEAAVFKAALTAEQVARLALGISPLCLSVATSLATYQSCVRRLNWPTSGPAATAASAPAVVAHPRVIYRRIRGTQRLPNRFPGPFQLNQGCLLSRMDVGEFRFGGIDGNGGVVCVPGLTAGEKGEVQS